MDELKKIDEHKQKDINDALIRIIRKRKDLDSVVLLGMSKNNEPMLFTSNMYLRDQTLLAAYLNAYITSRFGIYSE